MGGDTSKPLPPLPNNNYMALSTFSSDSLLLLYVSQAEVEAVRNAICSSWSKGIQSEEYICEEDTKSPQYKNCLKIKVKGNPFYNHTPSATGRDKGFEVRKMTSAILDAMYNIGWKLVASSDLMEEFDLNFWLFNKQNVEPDSTQIFTVGLASKDKLEVNGAPDEIHGVVKKLTDGRWASGVSSDEKNNQTYTIKMNGKPWSTTNKEESCQARMLATEIIQAMCGKEHYLYGSANIRGNADTLYFKHDKRMQDEVQHFCMSVHIPDTMRMMKFPDSICEAVREVVTEYWPKGIQDVKSDSHCYEIKVNGRPFCRQLDRDTQQSVYARRMITKIIEKLASLGYLVNAGLTVSRDTNDKCTFLFQKAEPVVAPVMCLSLNYEDQVEMISASEDVIGAVDKILSQWEKGDQEVKTPYDGLNYHKKLKGTPWTMFDADAVYGQAMLVGMLGQIESLGWRMVCSGDLAYKYDGQKHKRDYPEEDHCWWFMKDDSMLAKE